jgi:YD repeat-containing protein
MPIPRLSRQGGGDLRGRLVKTLDPLGRATTTAYDLAGRPISTSKWSATRTFTRRGVTAASSNTSSVSLPAAAGTLPGDLQVAVFNAAGTSPSPAIPSRWTLRQATTGGGANVTELTHTAAPGDPSTWTFTSVGGNALQSTLVTYTGTDANSYDTTPATTATFTSQTSLAMSTSGSTTVPSETEVAVWAAGNTATLTPQTPYANVASVASPNGA